MDAIRLAEEAESEVNSAQAHAQSDWNYVWIQTANAQAKLKKIQEILKMVATQI
jgi:hypothetical protein